MKHRTMERGTRSGERRTFIGSRGLLVTLILSAFLLLPSAFVCAYPPAPYHLFYGMLRDEYGTPVNVGAEVVMETSGGIRIRTKVIAGIEEGANYRLEVPMDSGLLAAPYLPTALRPTAPFHIKVRVGGVDYLPIEMLGDLKLLGESGQRTRLNLTLGEDSDGDGLPDAWERLIDTDLTRVRPDEDSDQDGLSNLQEYLAGTYAFDPEQGFELTIAGFAGGRPILEFLAVTGRNYVLLGSNDLKTWSPIAFRLPADADTAAPRVSLSADSVKNIRMEALASDSGTPPTYFRLKLQ